MCLTSKPDDRNPPTIATKAGATDAVLRSVALALIAVLSTQTIAAAKPKKSSADFPASISHINFGPPEFRHSPQAKRIFDDINRRELNLLEKAQWLSLDHAIHAALANNPDLAAAYTEIEGKRWSVIAARRRWYPTLSIEPGQDSTLQFGSQDASNANSSANILNQYIYTTATLEWTFFDASRGPAINATVSDLTAQRLLFDVAARNLVLEVQSSYYRLQEQMRLVDQYRLIALLATRLLDNAVEDQRKGMTDSNEVAQLRTTQHAQIRYLIDAYTSLYQISVELSRVLGLPRDTMVLASDSAASEASWNEDLHSTIAHAEKFREEIIAALQLSRAERWRSSQLLRSYWPKFSLLGVETVEAGEGSRSVGLGLKWSLYDGGINAADAINRRIASQTYALKPQSSRLQASAEVRQAHSRFIGASLNVDNAVTEVADSWNAFYGAIKLFSTNQVDATTLIQTQAQLVNAITDFEMAQRVRNTGLAELYRYSARWPTNVQSLFEQRVSQLQRHGVNP